MEKKFHQKAFTLIEMLIVIVIIGVLAAALIPRLTSVRDRANDVARKADLNQIATAVIARQMDHNGTLPGTGNELMDADDIINELKDAGLDSVPQDPKTANYVEGLFADDETTTSGQYGYMKLTKNGIADSAFVIMAKTETPGASNRLFDNTNSSGLITTGMETSNLIPCKTITKGSGATAFSLAIGGDCVFTNYNQLRYIIIR